MPAAIPLIVGIGVGQAVTFAVGNFLASTLRRAVHRWFDECVCAEFRWSCDMP
jgi:hypothetical protein